MTIALAEPSDDIYDLAFRLLASFAHVQEMIDKMLAKRFLETRTPKTSDFLWKSSIDRIRDADRPRLVTLIAADVESDADLSCFVDVYKRVKKLRDALAHSGRVTATSADEVELSSTLTFGIEGANQAPTKVTRAEISQALLNCAWAEAQVMYILDSSNLTTQIRRGDKRVEISKPPRLPKNWNGVIYMEVDDE